jgi:hypothetical protein
MVTRALLALKDDRSDTATWALVHHVWYCHSASKNLKWMINMENFDTVKAQLKARGFTWDWIVPNGTVIAPPFSK